MKKSLFITLLFQILIYPTSAQWVQSYFHTSSPFSSIHFPDSNDGYSVSNAGTFAKTTDAGLNWQLGTASTSELSSVFFVNADTGYAVGYIGAVSNEIIKTTNGGTNWTQQYFSSTANWFQSVYFLNPDTGFAVGNNIVRKTTDGGSNWTMPQYSFNSSILYSVHFPTPDTGYAVGDNSVLIKTTDGGSTWTQLAVFGAWSFEFHSVFFTSSDTGFAVGFVWVMNYPSAVIMKTTNGGLNWTQMPSSIHKIFNSVFFSNSSVGFVCGNYGIIEKTYDEGITWTEQSFDTVTNCNFTSVFFTNEDTGYIAGYQQVSASGIIIKTTNGGLTWTKENSRSNQFTIYPNPASNKIFISTDKQLGIVQVKLFNSLGQSVLENKVSPSQRKVEIKLPDLDDGIYFIKIESEKNFYSQMVIIQK